MESTIKSLTKQVEVESSTASVIRWRIWPLADDWRVSWVLPVGILGVGAMVWSLGGGWLMGLLAVAALTLALWQYFVPVNYEVCSLGLRRYALGRMRLVPWSAIRAYQLRSTGVAFFQKNDPTAVDLLNNLFVPYPSDVDDVVIAVRLNLPHANELP